jgi:hypothetical protein
MVASSLATTWELPLKGAELSRAISAPSAPDCAIAGRALSTHASLLIVASGPDERACIEASINKTSIVRIRGMTSQR